MHTTPTTPTTLTIANPPARFSPNPETTDKLIHDLCNPGISLFDCAELYNMSLESLTLWMARPDIAQRLAALKSAYMTRTLLVGANYFSTTVHALNTMIGGYIEEEAHVPVRPTCLKDREQRRRARESARKAVSLLRQIIQQPLPTPEQTTPPRAPRPRKVTFRDARPIAPAPLNLHDLRAKAGAAPSGALAATPDFHTPDFSIPAPDAPNQDQDQRSHQDTSTTGEAPTPAASTPAHQPTADHPAGELALLQSG